MDADDPAGGVTSSGFLTPDRRKRWSERLWDALALGIPLTLISLLQNAVVKPLTAQPWHALWYIAPLVLLGAVLWREAARRGSLRPRGPMLLFLICYLSIFTLAAGSELLVWKRSTVVLGEGELSRNWLTPASWGDWRYRVARRPGQDSRLTVLTMPPATGTVDQARLELARLIAIAKKWQVRGIAFDFYFAKDSSKVDRLLCTQVRAGGIPVLAGHRVLRGKTGPYPEGYAAELEKCFPPERRGHLIVYMDADSTIRQIPGMAHRSLALSSLMAALIDSADGRARPANQRTIRFVEPRGGIPVVSYQDLPGLPQDELRELFTGHFLLVGEASERERLRTPFGEQKRFGVQVHAAGVISLLTGTAIARPPWWTCLLIILIACYVMTVLAQEGLPTSRLAWLALGFTVFLVGGAALAMRLWSVWLDVIYGVVAVWLLLGLLVVMRRKLRAPPRMAQAASDAPIAVAAGEG